MPFPRRPTFPRRTIRLRLTVLYAGLFVGCGAALLVLTNVLYASAGGVTHVTDLVGHPPPGVVESTQQLQERTARAAAAAAAQRDQQLHRLWIESAIALAIMAVVSAALGWLVAGRVLRPLRDITRATRKITGEDLTRRLSLGPPHDELTELGDTIDDLLARLQQTFAAQQRFVSNASHELRTPLAMMRTSLDVAAAKATSAELVRLDGKLREGLDRADRLVEDFLLLQRAETAGLGDRASVALDRVVSDELERRTAVVPVTTTLASAPVSGNQPLLSHLVGNLIDNAMRHNVAGGWVRVDTRSVSGGSTLVVENSGPTLDADAADTLTEPFRRGDRTDAEGVGLGLTIVAAIARAHGGQLRLAPLPEGGLRVAVELPR
jgi:signal transduction histidine kinase